MASDLKGILMYATFYIDCDLIDYGKQVARRLSLAGIFNCLIAERAVGRQLLVLGQISYFPARSLLAKYVSASGISCASILDITRMLESGESMSYSGIEI